MTLRGPRRAGKTIALKLLVAELIEENGWDPKPILWLNFETFRTLAQIEEHLLEVSRRNRPKLILIDEATSVTGWQKVIKKLRDQGVLAEMQIILTGSSAHDLKAGAERMAGRRGAVAQPDRVLLPMSFREFQSQTPPGAADARAFLRVGGFPFRVEAFLKSLQSGRAWDDFESFQVFDDIVFYEINRRRLSRSIALEIIGRLASLGCSASSYEGFVKPLSISKDTGRKYLDALGDAFLLATFASYDTARNRVAPKKDKKFHWVDPALGFLAPWLKQCEAAAEEVRAEMAVGSELVRRFEARLFEGLSAPRNVFTWKSSGGNEIDFLLIDKSAHLRLPIEVKWQNQISDWDFQVLE